MYPTENGLAIALFDVDPPLLEGEVEICMDEAAPGPLGPRAMDDLALADMITLFEKRRR